MKALNIYLRKVEELEIFACVEFILISKAKIEIEMDEEIHNENSYFLHNRVSTTDRKRSSVMSLERGSYDPCR